MQAHYFLVIAGDERVPCLGGSTNFGDNIEDEWFITFLLTHITRNFDGAIAQFVVHPFTMFSLNHNAPVACFD